MDANIQLGGDETPTEEEMRKRPKNHPAPNGGITGREVGEIFQQQENILDRLDRIEDAAKAALISSRLDMRAIEDRFADFLKKVDAFMASSASDRNDLRQEVNIAKTELKTGLFRVGDLIELGKNHDNRFNKIDSEDARLATSIDNCTREVRDLAIQVARIEHEKLDRSSLVIYLTIVGLIIAFISFVAGRFAA